MIHFPYPLQWKAEKISIFVNVLAVKAHEATEYVFDIFIHAVKPLLQNFWKKSKNSYVKAKFSRLIGIKRDRQLHILWILHG